MTTLSLPWPPSTNHYWRHVGHKVLISAEGRAYRTAVGKAATHARANGGLSQSPLTSRVAVSIYAYPPDRRRRDLDNLFKALLDSLTHAGVWGDDCQIDELTIRRCPVVKAGEMQIYITTPTEPTK